MRKAATRQDLSVQECFFLVIVMVSKECQQAEGSGTSPLLVLDVALPGLLCSVLGSPRGGEVIKV